MLLAAVLLRGSLKRMDDLCNLSRDSLWLGAVMIVTIGEVGDEGLLRMHGNSGVCKMNDFYRR